MRTSEYGTWLCKECNVVFNTRREMFEHNKHCPNKFWTGNHSVPIKKETCPYCGNLYKSGYGLANHITLCRLNPNYNVKKHEKLSKAQIKLYNSEKGNELREKASKRTVFNNFWEYRSKNPIIYESKFAGRVKLDSKWELIVAKRLDELNINWYKPRIRLPYYDFEGNEHGYFPDFYVKDYKCFIEVKSPFISKWQNSQNKISYVKEHYKFVVWLESEEDCKSFILEKQDFDYDPQKAEDNIDYWLEQLNKKSEKHHNYKGGFIDKELEEKRWNSIQESNIDFSKFGWVDKLSKLWGISNNKAGTYVRKHFSKFYKEKCFKRNRVN